MKPESGEALSFIPYAAQAVARKPDAIHEKVATFRLERSWTELGARDGVDKHRRAAPLEPVRCLR